MTPDERDRLTRIEEAVGYIKENMVNLPPSPETVARLKEIELKAAIHEKFITTLKERIAWVSGAFSVVWIAMGYLGTWFYDKLHITFGGSQ